MTAALARPAARPPTRRPRRTAVVVTSSSTPPSRRAAWVGLFSIAALRPPIKRCETDGSGSSSPPFWTGLLGSPPCPEVADVENPWRRRRGRGGPEDLPELPAPRRDVGPLPPGQQPRNEPAERDALEAERAARTQEFVDSMWQTLE